MEAGLFKLRGVSADQKKRLAALAKERYGRASASLYVRHLIDDDLAKTPPAEPAKTPPSKHVVRLPKRPTFVDQKNRESPRQRIELRLQLGERQALNALAEATGSSPQNYLVALLRSHLLQKPQLLGGEVEVLRQANYQLAVIGSNLNQVAKALNAGQRRAVELKLIEELGANVKKHVSAMNAVLSANLSRWDVM